MRLKDKVAVVTGSASGINKAIVEGFAETGAAGVMIADIDDRATKRFAGTLSSKYKSKALAIQTNISHPDSVAAMVKTVVREFGRIDILVNNAGICPVVSWDQTTLEDWNRIIEINLAGMFLCTKAVIPVMKRRGNPDEVADAVLYLASDQATYITGEVLNVDGGFALR